MTAGAVPRLRYWRAAAALVLVGLVGIAVLVPVNSGAIAALPEAPARPALIALLAALQPTLILVLGALAGAFAAPRLGLVSLIALKASGRSPEPGRLHLWPLVFAVSVLAGTALVILDELARPLWLPAGADFPSYEASWSPRTLLFGLAYGGLTEEIMMRWGLMSLLAWILWRMRGRAPAALDGAVAGGLVAAALIFAAGHLPLLGTMVPLTPGPVVRTIALNGVLGIWFGWLYWRRCLEMAMLGHAGIHCGFALFAVGMRLVS